MNLQLSEENVIASVVKESFFEFLKEFWEVIVEEEPVFNWHVKFLCDELQTVAERVFAGKSKEYDLVINVPPGSTKSTICSQAFPAWCWTRMPSAKFICGCYAHPVALKDSLKTRDIVQSEKYKRCFDIQLREDENTKGLFTNTSMGFRLSVGVGGLVTGFHGHFLIVDDPINPEESFSEVELKATNRWMRTTLLSRKVDKKVTPLILIQQRLHQADPSGEVLERAKTKGNAKSVRHICLPGEITKNVSPPEVVGFYKEGLLDPIRLPRTVLEELMEDLGAYGYASQILQEPVPLGGGMFEVDKIHIMDEAPPPKHFVKIVRSWDKAGTQDAGMFSVGVKMGVDKDKRYWILDVRRGQWGSHKREEMIKSTAQDDGYDIEVLVEIEGGSGGKESGENTVINLAGSRVLAYHPTGDKEARAYPLSSQVGAGNVYCLNRRWTEAFIEELKHFPASRYKDQVDAVAAAFNRIARKRRRVGGAWSVNTRGNKAA